jgi:pimeloyl-ACP methyl ester carboxylesterase
MKNSSRRMQSWPVALLAAVCVTLAACKSPVRAVRADRTVAHRDLTRSAITTGEPSWPTRNALLERGLLEAFEEQPDAALADLHRVMIAEDGEPALLFALAELSFLHGEEAESREHRLAAAIYAYAFLFPEDEADHGAFDPRARMAANLYNWALAAAFASEDGAEFVPQSGSFALPFGEIEVAFDSADLRVEHRELVRLVPVAELEVEGLAMRYRRPGIGAALAASTKRAEDATGDDMVAPRVQVPLTALLRIANARNALVAEQRLAATLELHLAWHDDTVEIAGDRVPLESDPTAALALTFTGVPIVELELFGFLGRLSGLMAERPPLVSATAYRPGLIPVVFVHGTASSPVRWAELFNRLQADPEIRSKFQFWFFQYDSDNPIALSALRLRESLAAAIALLDPEGQDPALREMVLIGHSQGGLLVKMQSIETGDRLWNGVSRKPIDELKLSDETRELLERGLFLEPVPEVARVVFISTPHRGSFLAGYRIVSGLLRRLTHLPLQLTRVSADLARNTDAARSPFVASAVDNMSPYHPFIQGLQQIPVAPSIPAHSIISVKGDGPPAEGNDGVVEYTSAHIDGVESEVVVRSPHSCQAHPDTMEEVRRILRLHAELAETEAPTEPAVIEAP